MSPERLILPKEAIALVHFIELNKGDWWSKTIARLVMASVWLADEPPTADKIKDTLKESFKLTISSPKLDSIISSLENSLMLVRLPQGTFRIPDEKRAAFETEIAASEKDENKAKESFYKLVKANDESLDPYNVWTSFEQQFLAPLIKQVGVNAYRLIAGERLEIDPTLVDGFLKPFPSETHSKLRSLIPEFLDPKKPEVCSFISRLLHARLCVEASGLPEDVLNKINSSIGRQVRFVMFVDTNFLFSLLELHENPSNAAAQELNDLIRQLKSNPRIDFVITPETIEEAKSSIGYTKDQLSGLPSSQNFTEAALQGRFSGMALRFITERHRRHGQLSVKDWFDPYLKDFIPIARSKGVELYNEKLDGLSTRQDVIDDILHVIEFEKSLPENRRKSYQKVAHDMALWHFVNDKRSAYIESPVDANHWILTVDFRLIGFDSHKGRLLKSNVPICIHPTSLIQLLQFWIPRTKEFEEAMLGSLRLPFLFQEFDAEAERTSLTILKGIGRFDGSEALASDTITHIMLNEELRSRIQGDHTEEEEVSLIRDALVEEVNRLAETEAQRAKLLQEEINRRDTALADLIEEKHSVELKNIKTTQEKEQAEAAYAASEASVNKANLELTTVHKEKMLLTHALQQKDHVISDLETRLSAIETNNAFNKKVLRLIGGGLFSIVGMVTLIWLPAIRQWPWLQNHPERNSLYLAGCLIIAGLAWCIFAWKHRGWAISVIILGVLIQLIGVL